MFQTLVVQFKLVSMEYFMDELQSWEVNDLLKCLKYADQASWEQTRWLMYVVAQVNSKKQLKLQDIMHFPWDSERVTTTISNEDIKKLKAKAKRIEKDLLNGKADT